MMKNNLDFHHGDHSMIIIKLFLYHIESMGNKVETYKCPQHPENDIQKICVHPGCIEPLCDTCLQKHREQHNSVGTQP